MLSLVLKRIARVGVRSWGVGLAAMLVAGFALGVMQVMLGIQDSLHKALDRLGADILVVPEGITVDANRALLIALSDQAWMPYDTFEQIAAVPGVALASPQLILATLEGLTCCPDREVLLIAYDPNTDFTIRPWLVDNTQVTLKTGEAVVGSQIADNMNTNGVLEGEIEIWGYPVRPVAALEPTGTRLDYALFLSFETAAELAKKSTLVLTTPDGGLGNLSSVMVQVEPGVYSYALALEMMHAVPGINPVPSLDLFQSYRRQLSALLSSVVVVMIVTLVTSLLLTGLIFSLAANERRGELGVLRALGATNLSIFQSLMLETSMLACGGGLLGILLTGTIFIVFRRAIIEDLGIPFLPSSPRALFLQVGVGLAAALLIVTAAVLLPAYRISRQEPAFTMKV